jgi:FMN phosphatase YigB (HAD superfamily)
MQIPKACFFDVFGTLVDWRTRIAREAAAALKPRRTRLAGFRPPASGR